MVATTAYGNWSDVSCKCTRLEAEKARRRPSRSEADVCAENCQHNEARPVSSHMGSS